ncbi:2413_t:CDS:2 [Ambispora leptoticha]|uniref:2413_t:CDS:1 n=1 Tax=Ambispora leptoticha TaxID=144679 RepID=A0A9N9DXQ6_9GLOM|nr:2413_t:CDS:2 [Ambispora leptoticha]
MNLENIIGFLLVALCWGFTNPFIKNGSAGLENIRRDTWVKQIVSEVWYLITKWQYIVPLLLNLSGSVVYYYTLGQAGQHLSLAVPITNSLTFIFTTLAAGLLGEEIGTKETWIGMSMVVVGVGLCVSSKVE